MASLRIFTKSLPEPGEQAQSEVKTETFSDFDNAFFAGSILSADPLCFGTEVLDAVKAGIDIIHFDVMDYRFVPNLTFGPMILKAMKKRCPDTLFDAHLMVSPVSEQMVAAYAEAGAGMISVHPETCTHVQRMLAFIRSLGCRAGLALNPGTSPELLDYLWDVLDFVLVMTVNPGFGGQSVLPRCLDKIVRVHRMAWGAGSEARIEVDGGVSAETVRDMYDRGARIFVTGSSFFGRSDRAAALKALRAAVPVAGS